MPRLCLNSSAKLPKYLLGSVRDQLKHNGAIAYLSLTIAAWCRYLNGINDQGHELPPIDDPMADILIERAKSGGSDPTPLLNLTEIFGTLPQSARFVAAVKQHLQQLSEANTQTTLEKLLQPQKFYTRNI